MPMIPLHHLSTLVLLSTSSGIVLAAPQSRAPQAVPHAIQGVRTSPDDGATYTLVLRGGRIDAILPADADLPPGCHHVDGEGRLALPAFIDALTGTGCETPEPEVDRDRPVSVEDSVRIDMRQANRKGIQPAFAATDVLDFGEDGPEDHRESGFGLLLSAPGGQTLSGQSALATTRDAALRDVIVREAVFHHAAFRATGSGYPSTLMGYHAQLRQLFYDAQRNAELSRRAEANPGGPRPSFDPDLAATGDILAGARLVCEANSVRDIHRWIRLADEFGLSIAISGGREAWKCADELAERDIPVLLTLDWGEEVDDPDGDDDESEGDEAEPEEETEEETEPESGAGETEEESEEESEVDAEEEGADADSENDEDRWLYEEPIEVRRARRRLWEEGRDCALRLHEAGVRFAFGSGDDKPKDLLKRVRTLVEEGLERDVALAGLTHAAADLLSVSNGFGALAPGQSASLALWTKDPLTEKKAQVAWLFVDGHAYDFEVEPEDEEEAAGGEGPADGVDLTGTWTLESDSAQGGDSTAEIEMAPDGTLTGTIEFDLGGNKRTETLEGTVSGTEVRMKVLLSMQGMEITTKFVGEYDEDLVEGDMTIVFEGGKQEVGFTMERDPNQRSDAREGGL